MRAFQYFILIVGLVGSIASIISLAFTNGLSQYISVGGVVLFFSLVILVSFIFQLVKDRCFQIIYNILRNYIIKMFFLKKIKYNDFRSKIIDDGSDLSIEDESIRTAYFNSKVYITLKPRNVINSVQLSLFSKIKEITSYGIKAEIFLNDYDIDKKTITYYKTILSKFLKYRLYSIYRLSEMEDKEFSKIFKVKFEKGTKEIKVCWLLNQSANLLKTNIHNDGKLKFDIFIDDSTEKDTSIEFNKREIYTSDVLYPILEIINMQILSDKNRNDSNHYFVLSGYNMQKFWNETKEQLNHNFSSVLIPLLKNLTNTKIAMTGDCANCISLSKAENKKLFSNISNVDSMLEHYKLILFKNSDIIDSNRKNKALYFSDNLFFNSFEELKKHIDDKYDNDEKKISFMLPNFENHFNKLIDYVDSN